MSDGKNVHFISVRGSAAPSGKPSGKPSGALYGTNPSGGAGVLSWKQRSLAFRRDFAAEAWPKLLHSVCDAPETVAALWGVDGSTARKWWAGDHAPSGWAVAYAFILFPAEAHEALVRGWAGCTWRALISSLTALAPLKSKVAASPVT